MKKIFKIAILLFIIAIAVVPIIMLANNLYASGHLPDREVCERCLTTFCFRRVQLNPCEIQDGRIMFYLLASLILILLFWSVAYLIEKNSRFKFSDWIKGK